MDATLYFQGCCNSKGAAAPRVITRQWQLISFEASTLPSYHTAAITAASSAPQPPTATQSAAATAVQSDGSQRPRRCSNHHRYTPLLSCTTSTNMHLLNPAGNPRVPNIFLFSFRLCACGQGCVDICPRDVIILPLTSYYFHICMRHPSSSASSLIYIGHAYADHLTIFIRNLDMISMFNSFHSHSLQPLSPVFFLSFLATACCCYSDAAQLSSSAIRSTIPYFSNVELSVSDSEVLVPTFLQ